MRHTQLTTDWPSMGDKLVHSRRWLHCSSSRQCQSHARIFLPWRHHKIPVSVRSAVFFASMQDKNSTICTRSVIINSRLHRDVDNHHRARTVNLNYTVATTRIQEVNEKWQFWGCRNFVSPGVTSTRRLARQITNSPARGKWNVLYESVFLMQDIGPNHWYM